MRNKDTFQGKKIIGWGPWRYRWYSICSRHYNPDAKCELCQRGHYANCWASVVEHLIYKFCYPLWYWWMNRPNSAANRRLRKWFPGLRGKQED